MNQNTKKRARLIPIGKNNRQNKIGRFNTTQKNGKKVRAALPNFSRGRNIKIGTSNRTRNRPNINIQSNFSRKFPTYTRTKKYKIKRGNQNTNENENRDENTYAGKNEYREEKKFVEQQMRQKNIERNENIYYILNNINTLLQLYDENKILLNWEQKLKIRKEVIPIAEKLYTYSKYNKNQNRIILDQFEVLANMIENFINMEKISDFTVKQSLAIIFIIYIIFQEEDLSQYLPTNVPDDVRYLILYNGNNGNNNNGNNMNTNNNSTVSYEPNNNNNNL